MKGDIGEDVVAFNLSMAGSIAAKSRSGSAVITVSFEDGKKVLGQHAH